ncbi:MAG: hypothetical protein R3281_17665 [Balneolaceae bacterium]|nr:hypothetical protein [Balneolaceae bacterium]
MDTTNSITFGIKRTSKQHLNKLATLICALAFIAAGCSDSSTGTNGGENGGNGGGGEIGTEPTFTNVQMIFEQSCGGAGCHIGSPQNGVQLDGYDNVINSEGAQYGELVVQPNDANGSPLVDKIEADPQFGDRMPLGGSPLSQDRITQIREWIDNGAENN